MPDQEFHEVQLTFKKLLFLFMCAVILAGVIFSFGVSVGRGVRGASGSTPPPEVASDTMVPGDAPAAESPKVSEASPAALEGRGANPATVVPPPPPEEPTPAAAPPPAKTAPAPPAAAAPKPAPAATGSFIVQVEAFSSNDIATREVTKLKRKGYPALVFAAPDGTPGPRFKVQVGPYTTRAEADKTLKALRTEGYKPLIKR